MRRWRNRWADRAYVPRPKLRKLSEARRAEVLSQLRQGIEDSPVLSALGWTVHARRGRFYFEEAGEVVGRITPTGLNMLLLEVEGRSSWREEAKTPSASAVVEHMASDAQGTFHGLGPLDAVLREHGSQRLEMCPTGDSPNDWWYLDLAPADGTATVVEILYHAFGVPIPVIAEPRGWWERHRTPSIVEHRPEAVFVDFEQMSAYGNRFGGRCLYAKRGGEWDAYTIKPNQAASIDTSLAWLQKRDWRAW